MTHNGYSISRSFELESSLKWTVHGGVKAGELEVKGPVMKKVTMAVQFDIRPSSLELSTFARPSIFKNIHFHSFGLSILYLAVEFDYFRYRGMCIQSRTCRQTTSGFLSHPEGSSKRVFNRKIASIRERQPERHSANRTKYARCKSKDETICFSHRLSLSSEPW